MKSLKFLIVALAMGAVSHLSAQVDLNELSAAVGEAPENAAALVQQAVSDDPDQVVAIVNRLMNDFPALTEDIMFGAVSGLPDATPADIVSLVQYAVYANRALAPSIVAGARRASVDIPGVDQQITVAVRNILRRGAPGTIGRGTAGDAGEADETFTEVLRVSPSRTQAPPPPAS